MSNVRSRTASRIEVFEYPASAKALPVLWDELVEVVDESPDGNVDDIDDMAGCADAEERSVKSSTAAALEQERRNFEAGREQGIREGRDAEALTQRESLREAEQRGAEQAAHLANQFAVERDRFLQTVEGEVVKLALAIAARILRREAQTDPLFLMGAVRVALGQLARTLQVRLRVPGSEASLWAETLEHLPNLKVKPAVVPDESMHAGDCAIETDMGSVDLGLAAQLHQIEWALFDEAPASEEGILAGLDANRQEVQM
jgi:flagellar assembly protein FliH